MRDKLSTLHPIPLHWVAEIFERFSAMYGAKFADLWASSDKEKVRSEWAGGLAGMTGDDIAKGLEACKRKPWPPTLPEFLLMCKPSIDVDSALREAVEQMQRRKFRTDVWSNPKIYWAAQSVGVFDLLNLSSAALRPRFEAALNAASSAPVPSNRPALPDIGKAVTNKQEARENLKKLKSILGGSCDA